MTITIRELAVWKRERRPIVMLTAYDYSFAKWVARAGVPVILVGDSLGQVVLGHKTTLPVTLEDMLRHTAAVVRGAPECLVVADLPFMTYQASREDALRSAGRLLQETGAQAVKLEGGIEQAGTVSALAAAGIPVMGHIGLRPQSVHVSGYRTQAADPAGRKKLLADARALEQAGAFALVLEKVPPAAAREVSRALAIPVIGCGSGPDCDGQVLVLYDVLGLYDDFTPAFARRYADLGRAALEAVQRFSRDVVQRRFPAPNAPRRPPRNARPRRGDSGGART